MTMLEGWDLNAGGGNGKKNAFTKFPEGITKIRILSSAPHMRWAHWMPQFSRKITCPGFGCPIDEIVKVHKQAKTTAPYNSTRDYSLVIYNHDTGQREIMQEGVTMFEVLKDAIVDAISDHNEANPGQPANISSFVFKVRKKLSVATGKNTWTVSAEPYSELSDVEQNAKTDMPDLIALFAPPTVEQVKDLLQVQASNKDEAVESYNRIMGYAQQQDENGDLGIVTA